MYKKRIIRRITFFQLKKKFSLLVITVTGNTDARHWIDWVRFRSWLLPARQLTSSFIYFFQSVLSKLILCLYISSNIYLCCEYYMCWLQPRFCGHRFSFNARTLCTLFVRPVFRVNSFRSKTILVRPILSFYQINAE